MPLDRCPNCDVAVSGDWVSCPLCGATLDRDCEDDQELVADGGVEIEELTVDDDATIAEFAEIAEEQARGVDFLDEPDDADLSLVKLSASYLDADRMLRTFAVSAEGFDADDYGEPADEQTAAGDVLRDLFAHTFRHEADWSEWRKTLIVFALAEDVPEDTLREAHREAADVAGSDADADEFGEALEAAAEYREVLDDADREILTDGGVDGLNYRVRVDAPGHPIQFIRVVDMLSEGDMAIWNRRSEPVSVVAIEQEQGSPDSARPFRKTLLCEDRSRPYRERYRLTFEEGRDASESAPEIGDVATSCVVQRQVSDGSDGERWGKAVDIESLANVTPVQSIEGHDEQELRADGEGIDGEDLDDHTDDVGVPDGEGKDLGDTYVGADDARAARRALLAAVDEHADDTEHGAPVGSVIDEAIADSGAELRITLRQLKLLQEEGQIYESDPGVVRRTLADGSGIHPVDLDVGSLGMTFRGPGGARGGER